MDDIINQKVPLWKVDEVVSWVKDKGFTEYSSLFEVYGVDGDILLLLRDENVKEDLGMINGIVRKRFLRELKMLRRSANYSCVPGGKEMSKFLNSVGPDFREFTYNLVTKDMSLKFMKELEQEDLQEMFKEAGVDNLVLRYKLVETITELASYDSLELNESNYDVYLTHSLDQGAELASLNI